MMIYEARRLGKDEACLIFVWFVFSRCPTIALVRESGIRESFTFGILTPGLWDPEYNSGNPESN